MADAARYWLADGTQVSVAEAIRQMKSGNTHVFDYDPTTSPAPDPTQETVEEWANREYPVVDDAGEDDGTDPVDAGPMPDPDQLARKRQLQQELRDLEAEAAAKAERNKVREDAKRFDADTFDFEDAQAKIVGRRKAKERVERDKSGMLMELPHTGGYARVRLLNIVDKNTLGWIPDTLNKKLANVLQLIEQTARDAKVYSATEAVTRLRKETDDLNAVADAFCVHGFVQPRLVATEQEADEAADDMVMWVEELHIDERIAYFNLCFAQGEGEDVVLIDPFRRKLVAAVSHRQGN